jgi:hypothetical protein
MLLKRTSPHCPHLTRACLGAGTAAGQFCEQLAHELEQLGDARCLATVVVVE